MLRRNALQINWFTTSAIFLSISVISLFFISAIFIMFLPQFFISSAGDSVTQSGAPTNSLISVIHDVICCLGDDPTHKELRAEASQDEERPTFVAQENVTIAIAQQDVTKQPTTYKRKA
jgi:hypothetical protein